MKRALRDSKLHESNKKQKKCQSDSDCLPGLPQELLQIIWSLYHQLSSLYPSCNPWEDVDDVQFSAAAYSFVFFMDTGRTQLCPLLVFCLSRDDVRKYWLLKQASHMLLYPQ